ncbi:[Pyruvate dehydrogenase (acetyl-transferring)] kinase isozyme 4 [Nowakowskiella sp. JEL0407]|nr:[Pyruvate dehydrogenase (acetyl-transferring)] kinase isozyme 4 [Nowakowskiella sp. JEL0407]
MAASISKLSKMPLIDCIKHLSAFPQTPVSLKQMVEFSKSPNSSTLLNATQFIHDELPIRLAHRVVELESLPHQLSEMPSIHRVKQWYIQSFEDLIKFPSPEAFGVPLGSYTVRDNPLLKNGAGSRYFQPSKELECSQVAKYNESFVKCIENIKRRHDPVVTTVAKGIVEVKEHWKKSNSTPLISAPNSKKILPLPTAIQAFLDRFYMSRIGIRMLIGQHVALSKPPLSPDYVGIICTKTSVRDVSELAADNARFICSDYYGLYSSPTVKIILQDDDLQFMYVPSHLQHMVFELLKNSLRAVLERFGVDADTYPEIKMIVASGKEDITIKISDEGGGIPRSGTDLLWTYMYSTAQTPDLEEDFNKSDFRAPLAGYVKEFSVYVLYFKLNSISSSNRFGYGLPLSRLYARYFGGDLKLISMEGYGTDVYLQLSRLSDSEEPLP